MNPNETLLLQPVLVLATWSIFMALWMFATRIPAMTKANLGADAGKHTKDMQGSLPSQVRAIGDNFNNLFELPVVFYVVAITIYLAGDVDMIAIYLAWGFAGFRILHSLIQSTYNNVLHRFGIYMLSLLCVLGMAVRELMQLF